MRGASAPPQAPGEGRPLAGGDPYPCWGRGPKEPLKLCKRGITSIHAHDCQEGGGLRASLSKELPQENVAFIGFAAGGWVDIKLVVNLGCVWTAVCVKPAPLTQEDCGDDALWWTQ